MVKTCVLAVSRHSTSYTRNDYSLIPQIPPLTFMAAIFYVITSSPLKMKMVFIHTKMSSHSQGVELPGWRDLVCGHICVSVCVQQLFLR